jgi:hypothetical protein
VSYWSLRRAAQRPAGPHQRAHTEQSGEARPTAPEPTRDWTPVDRQPVEPASAARTLLQRMSDLEDKLWQLPTENPEDTVPGQLGGTKIRARSSW